MKATRLERVLRGVLLAGAPFAVEGCILGESSCPDNGTEPPLVVTKQVAAGFADGGPLSAEQCEEVCTTGDGVLTCVRESAETVLCLNNRFPCTGRRPAGLPALPTPPSDALGSHLAHAAYLEAASVGAFRDLRRELRHHGAPRRLLRATSRSARDERRHTRAATALARRFGALGPRPPHGPSRVRSLAEIALENAVEGCVRETWGALIGLRQAAHAKEPSVRAAMSRIAPDEVRHAELAWAVDRWLSPRLNAEERARVRGARAAALADLRREVACPLPVDERLRLGLPSAEEAAALLEAFAQSLPLGA